MPAARPALAVLLFVSLWMALGWLLRLDRNAYVLLGVPLTLAFQLWVRRQPVRALWVSAAPALRPNAAWVLATLALAALPLYKLVDAGLSQGAAVALWYVAAVVGAPAAAYALMNLDRRALRALIPAAVMLAVIGTAMAARAVQLRGAGALSADALLQIARWSLLYFAACFVLEEVTFRGALDSHVRAAGRRGWPSAAWVALLWGLWHLPITPLDAGLVLVTLALALYQLVVGLALAYAWRIGANLAVPAAAHALLNALRNTLLLSGTA